MEGLDGRYVDIGFSGAALIVLLALGVCLVAYFFLKKRVPRKTILLLLLLFLVGYGIRLFIILSDPLVPGLDGPWYVTQVKSIVGTGAPSEVGLEPIVMYLASGASVFVNDATLGLKITQAFFSALPVLTIWLLVFYITKSNLASSAAALLTVFSAASMGMFIVSLKNSGALAFLPLFYLFFFKFINGEGREWAIKSLKIRGKKLGLTLNTNLVLSLLIYLVILGCHFLTAGLAVMTVVAYTAFFAGYRRKIPWKELKFMAVLGVLVLVGMAASGTIRDKIIGTSNTIATSEPVPPDMFPFYEPQMPTAPGVGGAGSPGLFTSSLPFFLIALPAMWFTLRQSDRRYLLFTAAIPLILLCYQNWIVNYMYDFRFMLMIHVPLIILGGVSVWYLRKRSKAAAAVLLVFGVGFSAITMVSMGDFSKSISINEETWAELRSIGVQLPENSIVITPADMALFYWGPLLFDKVSESTFFLAGNPDLNYIANQMVENAKPGMISLAVVRNDLVAGQDLESLGLEFYDNVRTENYCVLKLAENSDNAQPRSVARGEGPGGLPEYPGATKLEISEEDIEENYLGGYFDLSPPEVSAAVYNTTASYSEVLGWYKTEMPKLGWTKCYENENSERGWGNVNFLKGESGALISVNSNPGGQLIVLMEGPTEMLGWSTGPQGGPFQELTPTNEIRFNYNPLFAFILLPVELVQALYGTAVYGILKLVVAIPLSVGLIGFLLGLGSIFWQKFKGRRKIRRRK